MAALHFETMTDRSNDDVERSGTALASVLDRIHKHRRLRGWVRWLDTISEGAHAWPSSSMLCLGTLVVAVAWLCLTSSADNLPSLHAALETESDLDEVVAALQQERLCAVACPMSPSPR